MSDSAERRHRSDGRKANRLRHRTQPLRRRIAQLELELRVVRKQALAQRQRIVQKYGYEFLALIESDRNCKVVVRHSAKDCVGG